MLLRTLLRTHFYCKTHRRPPSQNPSENPFPRTLPRTFSEPFSERCVAVRPLRRAPYSCGSKRSAKGGAACEGTTDMRGTGILRRARVQPASASEKDCEGPEAISIGQAPEFQETQGNFERYHSCQSISQARKRSTNPNFWIRISSVGMGVFHVKGWGPKRSVCPLKPREKKPFLWEIPRDVAGGGGQRVCVQNLAPNFKHEIVIFE